MDKKEITIGSAIGITVLFFFLMILLGYFVGTYSEVNLKTPLQMDLSLLLKLNMLAFLLVLVYCLNRYQVQINFRSPVRPTFLFAGSALLTVLGLGIVMSEIDNILREISPSFSSDSYSTLFQEESTILIILTVAFFAPLMEEILFRGIILNGLLPGEGRRRAIIISAVLFGIMHFSPSAIINGITAGLLLGYIYTIFNSVLPGIIVHSLYNALPIIISRVFQLNIPGYDLVSGVEVLHQPLYFNLLGTAALLLGLKGLMSHPREEHFSE